MLKPGLSPQNGAELLFTHVTPDPNPGCDHIFVYKGIRCSQSREVFGALDALDVATWDEPAQTIIEIGTLYGAFTHVLCDHNISRLAEVHTFDIVDTLDMRIPVPNARGHLGDVFTAQFPTITSLIRRPGRCFVFCDGGYKEREVNVISEYLKPGDLILCHDYMKHPSMMGTEAAGYWPGCESQYANIKDALDRNGCEPFMEAAMQKAVWGSWIRTK
jgi:hypothetical protein